jgi:hypothetical protein
VVFSNLGFGGIVCTTQEKSDEKLIHFSRRHLDPNRGIGEADNKPDLERQL